MEFFDKFIVGQEYPKKALVRALSAMMVGMKFTPGPLSKFLLVGGPGTGKTLAVKTLALFLFGEPNAFLRISGAIQLNLITQMELDKHGYQKLLGAKFGKKLQKIAEKENFLTESLSIAEEVFSRLPEGEEKENLKKRMGTLKKEMASVEDDREKVVEKCPYRPGTYPSILLIEGVDEIDEAFQNLIGQILNQGIFQKGDEDVSLKNCFVFMTARTLSEDLSRASEKTGTIGLLRGKDIVEKKRYSKMRDSVLPKTYSISPHLLKEIGKENIVVFDPLDKKEMIEVIKRQVTEILLLLDEMNIKTMVSESVYEYIYKETQDEFNKRFGASSVERIIEGRILHPLRNLLQREKDGIKEGDAISIETESKNIIFEKITL